MGTLLPQAFIEKWSHSTLKERASFPFEAGVKKLLAIQMDLLMYGSGNTCLGVQALCAYKLNDLRNQ